MVPKNASPAPNIAKANLRPSEAAEYVGISKSKLAKLRMQSERRAGPRFVKVAGCVLYRRSDLDEWIAAHLIEAEAK